MSTVLFWYIYIPIAHIHNRFLNCKNYLSFSSEFSPHLFLSSPSPPNLMEQGEVGGFASGGKIFLQEFPAILTSIEILMATHHLLAKRPVPQSFFLPRVFLILTSLNQSIACNLASVYLNRCSLCCFLVVKESFDCRNGMSRYQTKKRKRSQENLFKPF